MRIGAQHRLAGGLALTEPAKRPFARPAAGIACKNYKEISIAQRDGLLSFRLPRSLRDALPGDWRVISWTQTLASPVEKRTMRHAISAPDSGPDLNLNQLLDVLRAMQAGNFSVRLPGSQVGVAGKICDTFNTIIGANQRIAQQLEHVGEVVGRQGKTRTRVRFGLSDGAWADMESSVNTLIDDLLWPTTAVTRTVTAVARGDLLQTVPSRDVGDGTGAEGANFCARPTSSTP